MTTLYKIDEEYQDLLNKLEFEASENDGVISDELSNRLEDLSMARAKKVKNTALYIKNQLAMSKSIADEVKWLKKRKTSIDKNVERLKEYLKFILKGEEVEGSNYKISYNTSKSVNNTLVLECISKFYIVNDLKLDKKLAREHLLNGIEIEGLELVEKTNINIK